MFACFEQHHLGIAPEEWFVQEETQRFVWGEVHFRKKALLFVAFILKSLFLGQILLLYFYVKVKVLLDHKQRQQLKQKTWFVSEEPLLSLKRGVVR